jgi:hypothetical protein
LIQRTPVSRLSSSGREDPHGARPLLELFHDEKIEVPLAADIARVEG